MTKISRNIPDAKYQALINANNPSPANPFATVLDLLLSSGVGVTIIEANNRVSQAGLGTPPVPNMLITPDAGTYLVQTFVVHSSTENERINTFQLAIDGIFVGISNSQEVQNNIRVTNTLSNIVTVDGTQQVELRWTEDTAIGGVQRIAWARQMVLIKIA